MGAKNKLENESQNKQKSSDIGVISHRLRQKGDDEASYSDVTCPDNEDMSDKILTEKRQLKPTDKRLKCNRDKPENIEEKKDLPIIKPKEADIKNGENTTPRKLGRPPKIKVTDNNEQ